MCLSYSVRIYRRPKTYVWGCRFVLDEMKMNSLSKLCRCHSIHCVKASDKVFLFLIVTCQLVEIYKKQKGKSDKST